MHYSFCSCQGTFSTSLFYAESAKSVSSTTMTSSAFFLLVPFFLIFDGLWRLLRVIVRFVLCCWFDAVRGGSFALLLSVPCLCTSFTLILNDQVPIADKSVAPSGLLRKIYSNELTSFSNRWWQFHNSHARCHRWYGQCYLEHTIQELPSFLRKLASICSWIYSADSRSKCLSQATCVMAWLSSIAHHLYESPLKATSSPI